MQWLQSLFVALCSLLALAGAAYFALCVWAAERFRREATSASRIDFEPPVSIMKSLKGIDPKMYSAFRSHCLLDYAEYELLF